MISTVSSQTIISKKHLTVYIFLMKPFLCHSYHPMNKQRLRQNVKPFCLSPCFTYPNALLYDRHKHCPAVNRKNDSYLRGSIIHTVPLRMGFPHQEYPMTPDKKMTLWQMNPYIRMQEHPQPGPFHHGMQQTASAVFSENSGTQP